MSLPIKRTVLPNKLTIVEINFPHFHSVTNFLVIRSGARYETAANNGIAHFLEHMVFKGTKSFANSKAIAESIEGIGGYFNAWTSNDHTAYWNTVPASQWRRGIQVAAELAFTPKLRREDLERERGVIIEEIRRMYDDPTNLVDDLFGEVLFAQHQLGQSVIGREPTIEKMTIEQFRAYHAAHYAPSQAYFVCVGNLTGLNVVEAIAEELGELKAQNQSQIKPFTGTSKQGLLVHQKDTDQTHFMLGVASDELGLTRPERFVAVVLNAVLGRGMSSRLFLNIRERKGLAYDIHSSFHPFEDAGLLAVSGGVNTAKINQTLDALEEEFASLRTKLVGPSELNKAKALVIGSFDLSADRPVDLATWYGTSFLLGMTEDHDKAKKAVGAVTAGQVRQLAAQLLTKDKLALAVVGPYSDEKIFRDFLQAN